MENDLDAALRCLTVEDHPGLPGLERAVLVRVDQRRRSGTPYGSLLALTGLGAITLGVLGGVLSPSRPLAADLSSLGSSNPLAPSTLLAADR